MEEVDFLCWLVGSNDKERTDIKLENARKKQEIADIKLENARKKQEIADMKLEKAGMKIEINTLTFGLQHSAGSDDEIQFYTSFPSYSTLN